MSRRLFSLFRPCFGDTLSRSSNAKLRFKVDPTLFVSLHRQVEQCFAVFSFLETVAHLKFYSS